jgi:hypothetical protein
VRALFNALQKKNPVSFNCIQQHLPNLAIVLSKSAISTSFQKVGAYGLLGKAAGIEGFESERKHHLSQRFPSRKINAGIQEETLRSAKLGAYLPLSRAKVAETFAAGGQSEAQF